jgi:hypothetical protein
MSIAAWKGFLQLFYAPSYWEKTKHGLYKANGTEIAMLGDVGAGPNNGEPHGGHEPWPRPGRALIEERP